MISQMVMAPLVVERPEDAGKRGPSADDILAKYVQAMGGHRVLSAIESRELRGTAALDGNILPVDILNKRPGKQIMIVHLPKGDSVTAYNSPSGWTSGPNRPSHELPQAEVVSAQVETDISLARDMPQFFRELRTTEREKIRDRECYVLSGFNSGELTAKFYFDEDSGLLVRLRRYTKSPLGMNPIQIDYADYRTQDGAKVPFKETVTRPNSRVVIQIQAAKFNIPMEDTRFVRPSMESAKPPVP